MTYSLHGMGVSRGIAIGNAHVLLRDELDPGEYTIAKDQIEAEQARLAEAIAQAAQDLRAMRDRIPPSTRADVASFIDAHLLMLQDAALTDEPMRLIRERRCNAEWALKQQRDAIVEVFERMDDPYLRTRRDDVDHVVNRVLRILMRQAPLTHEAAADGRLEGMVLVADDLAPADALLMQHQGIVAFVTEFGGPTSHTSILARSLGIPGVVGVHHVRRFVREGEPLIVDGSEGVVVGEPDQRLLGYYRLRREEEQKRAAGLARLKRAPAATVDGEPVELHANVELPPDFKAARAVGAQGVGLYRTEFLFMNRTDRPSEEEHFESYRALVQALPDLPVTIRTLDIGADKQVDSGVFAHPNAANPALGLRAVRLGLKEPDLFMPQLRAIVRVSALGSVRLMIPMLSNLEEACQVIDTVRRIQAEFAADGIPFDPAMPIGGMIEVPAAAVYADGFARLLDFLSIGTNDLIQYAVAIDRINDEVNYLYNPLNPGVLRLISMTIKAARAAGVPVAMCGEMAGDVRYTRLLIGMGLRAFSVHPSVLLEVKAIINQTAAATVGRLAQRLLRTADPARFRDLLAQIG